MANNELDAILAEIRKKAQENEASEKTAAQEELPVDVINTSADKPQAEPDDLFSDILKAVGAEKKEKAPAPAPQPELPKEEPAVPAADEAPESIFTFTEDKTPEPAAAPEEAAEMPEELPVDKEDPIEVPDGKAFDTAAFGLITGAAAEKAEEAVEETAEAGEEDDGDGKDGKDKKKALVIALICLIVIAALVGVYFGFFHNKKAEDTTESQPPVSESVAATAVTEKSGGIVNPLTGEPDYNAAAVGKRPVAVVVENEYSTKAIRPQWGIEDPDIIMEAETEFSTRMLFFWADYTDVPEKVGPTRSARPPFIHFAQLYDAVYIHAGLSHSKGDYVGADSVFENEGIDHINLLSYEENGTYIGRDKSRTSTIEHTGYLNGTNCAELIEKQGFRTDLDATRFTQFEFNEKPEATGTMDAKTVGFKWSSNCPKHAKFTYDEEDGVYRTSDFDEQGREADLKFETLMLLLDETVYVKVENYKGSGNSETYCNYNLSGGKCLIATEGKASECTWSVESGKIVIKDEKGQPIKLNPGKIYIGYGSSNNGGSYTVGETDSNN